MCSGKRSLGGQQATAEGASQLLGDATKVKAFARSLLIEQGVDVTMFRRDTDDLETSTRQEIHAKNLSLQRQRLACPLRSWQ